MATSHEPWLDDYRQLTEAAGVADVSGIVGQVEMTGPDRAAFLNRLATNKIDRLPPGAGCETFLADPKGRVLAYLWLFVRPESLTLLSAAGQAERIVAHLDHYLIREKVEIRDRSREASALFLSGKRSAEVLGRLIDAPLSQQPMTGIETEIASSAIGLWTLDAAGTPAWLLLASRAASEAAFGAIQAAGASACGLTALESLRIEAGWPVYGLDITEENLPQEVARERQTLSFNKGCYLGQETIARLDSRGHVNRTLVGLRFGTPLPPPAGTELTAEGAVVGAVTSSAVSPRLGTALALGYVRRGHNAPGAKLESSLGPAEVVGLPVAMR